MITTLDKYGRIIIPKKIRVRLGISTGVDLNIEEDGKRLIIEPVQKEEPIVEKDGILVFTGKSQGDPDLFFEAERENRMKKLLGER